MSDPGILRSRAKALNLHGLLANWDEAFAAGWAQRLLGWEEEERARRSLERRIRAAHIGRFKPLCDFDWNWPKSCDRAGIEGLMLLEFVNPGHWKAFADECDARKAQAAFTHLNSHIERPVIDLWATRIGFEKAVFVSGDAAPWETQALGQSLAVLRKRR